MHETITPSQSTTCGDLKQWLKSRIQGLLGVHRLIGQLTEVNNQISALACSTREYRRETADNSHATIARIAVLAEAVHRMGEALDRIPVWLDSRLEALTVTATAADMRELDELRSLEKQGLFILGCARSGTTILTRSLNRSPEVLLLEEPNCFLHQHLADFVGWFNRLHESMGNFCMKGTYLPPLVVPATGPIDVLLRLRGDYRYLGEKTAIGPHDYPPNWARAYLDFQGKYFLRAKYIYILRTPVEAIWSLHKMFPDRPVTRLCETWLEALALSLDAYHVFPNSRMVFFDELGEEMIDRLGHWLDLPIPILRGTFGRKYIRSALEPDDIPQPLLPLAEMCRECTALYQDLRASFSTEDFVYDGSTTEWAYFDSILRHVRKLIDKLKATDTEGFQGLGIAA